jgi:NADPH2:quinone reductase
MRAWQVTGVGEPADVLKLIDDVELPTPGPGFLRVLVAATGIGLPDLLMCRDAYALTPPRPFTSGQEAVGIVTAVGDGAQCKVGDRVMGVTAFFVGQGGFADECLMLDDFALPVPDEMDDIEAAGFSIGFHTAFIGLLRRGALSEGETLVVLGAAGGTGQAALQLGKAVGARVIAVAGGSEKCGFCRVLGADDVIDYRSEDIAEAVRSLTDGKGADVVWDAVGGETFTAATRCIASEGRVLLVGFGSGSWGQPQPEHMAMHNYSVVGVIPSSYGRDFRLEAQLALIDLWRAEKIRVAVHGSFPFERLPSALEELGSGQVKGKIVLLGSARPDQA